MIEFKPLRNNIIVDKLDNELKTEAGIVLTRTDEADKALVVSIGPDVTEVQVGEKVLVNWQRAKPIKDNRYIMSIDEVVAVFEDEN